MPIFMCFGDSGAAAGGASGGVWKTTNFLTADARPGTVRLSRISLVNGVGGVDGRDPMPSVKALQLFETAKSQGPSGRLYVATDTGVYNHSASANNRGKLIVGVDNTTRSGTFDGRTRLTMGTDQGVFSRPGAGVLKSSDAGRTWQTRHAPTIDIVIVDAAGTDGHVFRLKNATMSPGPNGTQTITYTGLE